MFYQLLSNASKICNMFIFMFYSAHIYDAVEMRSRHTKPFSNPDHTTSNSKIIPASSEQDMKEDNVKLQENPAYAATNDEYY